jgi:hypothetical protein
LDANQAHAGQNWSEVMPSKAWFGDVDKPAYRYIEAYGD